ALLREHGVVEIEVAEVVRRDRVELLEHGPRLSGTCGELVAVLGQELRKRFVPVDEHGAHPRQVVEPDLVDEDAVRRDVDEPGDLPLNADCDVAEADGPVVGVAERTSDDADGVGEIDDPGVGCELGHARRDLEHHRHGPERLRQASGSRRLLADAAARKRDRLVAEARGLTADAQLHQDERRAVQCAVELVGDEQASFKAGRREHPPREPADDLAPLGIDVLEYDLAKPDAVALTRQAGDQLGRVRRPSADDGELHGRRSRKEPKPEATLRPQPGRSQANGGQSWVNLLHEMRATPPLLKHLNERTVLEAIRSGAPISRAEISRRVGISKPTVSLALRSLEEAGLVREAPEGPDGPSYGAVFFEPVPDAAFVLGLDLGSRFLRGAVVDLAGRIRARQDVELGGADAEGALDAIRALHASLFDRPPLPHERIDGVVLGIPGVVEPSSETLRLTTPHIPGLEGRPFAAEVRQRVGLPVALDNDINLAAVGERWAGIARGVDDFAFLSVGMGTGVGLVLGGELHRGTHGAAGEIDWALSGSDDDLDPSAEGVGALAVEVSWPGI